MEKRTVVMVSEMAIHQRMRGRKKAAMGAKNTQEEKEEKEKVQKAIN